MDTLKEGCTCCHGDEAIFWKDAENNAFIDSTGEMMVTVHDHIIRFRVSRCPNCGFEFEKNT